MLADVFALYIKTKNFHWHMRDCHFRDYHLLLDEHADQIIGITDEIAERARKLGATTLRSIGDITRHQQEIALRHTSVKKNEVDGVRSTHYVPLRDVIAFTGVLNKTIKPYLAAKGNSTDEVEKMHTAWCKAIQLQMALWIGPYADARQAPKEW